MPSPCLHLPPRRPVTHQLLSRYPPTTASLSTNYSLVIHQLLPRYLPTTTSLSTNYYLVIYQPPPIQKKVVTTFQKLLTTFPQRWLRCDQNNLFWSLHPPLSLASPLFSCDQTSLLWCENPTNGGKSGGFVKDSFTPSGD